MGYFRFSLMLAVMYYHIVYPTVSAYLAVHGFFVLSGYVITLTSVEIYGNGWKAKKYFLLNRLLRIYPVYLASIAISLLCMWATGFTTQHLHHTYRLPDEPLGWLYQFTIIGLSNTTPVRYPAQILPAAWSLSTEMVYYLSIGLITGANKRWTWCAFILSLANAGIMLISGDTFKWFYLSIQGPAYAFYLGSLCYHYRQKLDRTTHLPLWLLIVLTNLLIYGSDFIDWGHEHPFMPLYFIASVIFAWLVQAINAAQKRLRQIPRWEALLGDLTYPAFLLHWPIGAVLAFFLFNNHRYGWALYGLTLCWTLVISLVLVYGLEKPLQPWRERIRQRV